MSRSNCSAVPHTPIREGQRSLESPALGNSPIADVEIGPIVHDVSGIGLCDEIREEDASGLSFQGSLLSGAVAAERAACSSAGDSRFYEDGGVPAIPHRRYLMSVDQFLTMCTELKIMPDMVSRVEAVRIFKGAQLTGSYSNYGSSLFGHLSQDAFVDAAGQLAIEAYSKPPYCDDGRPIHEKVQEFFLQFLPSSAREMHDRFKYGRNC